MNIIDNIILLIASKGKFYRKYTLHIWGHINLIISIYNICYLNSNLINLFIIFSSSIGLLVLLRLKQTGGWWWTNNDD